MSKQPTPAPTASAGCPCPTIIQIVGRPGTGSLPSAIAPPDHPNDVGRKNHNLSIFLCPFEIISMKIVSALQLKNRRKYFVQKLGAAIN